MLNVQPIEHWPLNIGHCILPFLECLMHIPGRCCLALVCALAAAVLQPSRVSAETGYDAWLRYAPVPRSLRARYREIVPAVVVVLGDDGPVEAPATRSSAASVACSGGPLRLESPPPARTRDRPRHTSALPRRILHAVSRRPTRTRRLPPQADSLGRHPVSRRDGGHRSRRSVRCLRVVATNGARPAVDEPRRGADARGADPMGEPVGQPRWHDRARVRRPVDFLGGRPCRART